MTEEKSVYIMDKQNHYYKRNAEGQLVVALNKEDAGVFTTKDALNRVGKKLRYYSIVAAEVVAKGDTDHSGNEESAELVSVGNLEGLMRQLCDISDNLSVHKELIERRRVSIDQEITDIEHYLEFYELSDAEMVKACKKLQQCRRLRRKCKDELARIEFMTEEFMNKSFSYSAHKVLARMESLYERQYTPRQLPELFSDMKAVAV